MTSRPSAGFARGLPMRRCGTMASWHTPARRWQRLGPRGLMAHRRRQRRWRCAVSQRASGERASGVREVGDEPAGRRAHTDNDDPKGGAAYGAGRTDSAADPHCQGAGEACSTGAVQSAGQGGGSSADSGGGCWWVAAEPAAGQQLAAAAGHLLSLGWTVVDVGLDHKRLATLYRSSEDRPNSWTAPVIEHISLKLPTALLEQILRLAAAPQWASTTTTTTASAHLAGFYCSCHAGRSTVSALITASTTILNEKQAAHGQATALPMHARCMRKLTCIVKTADPAAISRFLHDPAVQRMLARVQELQLLSWHPSHVPPVAQTSLVAYDVAALAAACSPPLCPLQHLTLRPRSAMDLQLAPLAGLSGLQSLVVQDYRGDLSVGQLSELSRLTALSSLSINLRIASARLALFPALLLLRGLRRLSLNYAGGENFANESVLLAGDEVQQVSQLTSLCHLTHLQLKDMYTDEQPGQQFPYLRPFSLCTRLATLELPYLICENVRGVRLVLDSMPHLSVLELDSILLNPDENPESPPPPHPTSSSSFSPPDHPKELRLKMQAFRGRLADFLALRLPPGARCDVGHLRLALGSAPTPAAVASVSEHLRHATASLQLVPHLELTWEDVPTAPAAPAIAALGPLGRRLDCLTLERWGVDRGLAEQIVGTAPQLRRLELTAGWATGPAWAAFLGLAGLSSIDVNLCAFDADEMAAFAAAAPELSEVGVPREARDALERARVQRQERGLCPLTIHSYGFTP